MRLMISPFSRSAAVALLATGAAAIAIGARASTPVAGRRMPLPPRLQIARWSDTSGGPAALGTVLAAYGTRLQPAQLEQMTAAVGKKATLASLQTGAQAAQFKAALVLTTAAGLEQQPLPAIAEWSTGEFRVFVNTGFGRVEIYNPEVNQRGQVPLDQLSGWTGRLLLLHPKAL